MCVDGERWRAATANSVEILVATRLTVRCLNLMHDIKCVYMHGREANECVRYICLIFC